MSFTTRTILVATAASIALTASLSLAAAPVALAGTYTVSSCRTASGQAVSVGSWQDALDSTDGDHHDFWGPTCPGPVYMGMDAGFSHVNGDYVEETFTAPPNTTIQSYVISRAVRLVPSAGYLYQAWARSGGQWQLVEGCTSAAECRAYGNYAAPASATANQLVRTAPPDTTQIRLQLTCARSGGCPEVKSEGSVTDSIWLFSSAVTLAEDSAPQFVGSPSGPLVVPGAVLAGTVPVTIAASDPGSGVYEASVEIDGHVTQSQVLDNSTGMCQQPFAAVQPCPLSANATIGVATNSLRDGAHNLTLIISNAAGTTAAWGPMTITTRNNPCSPSPPVRGMMLHAGFVVRTHRRSRLAAAVTTRYGRRPIVAGRLSTPTGAPVADAPICVAVRDGYAGARIRAVATLSTSATGGFRYRIGAGPSRTMYFIYRVPGGAVSDAVNVHVHVPVRVHVNSHRLFNGQVMTWRGRLPGPVPSEMLALMQVWRGSYWQTFQQVHVSKTGKWAGRYRFSFTTGLQQYLFRLAVPRESGYPYAAGVSRRIPIVVTG